MYLSAAATVPLRLQFLSGDRGMEDDDNLIEIYMRIMSCMQKH